MNPAALGIITATITSPARRAKAIGIWDAAYGLSMVAGPLAGGVLTRVAGWRAVFDPGIVAGLAALALTGLVAPESRASRPRRPDPAGQALVTVLLAALAVAIIKAPGWGWRAPRTAALGVLVLVVLCVLVRAETRRPEPLIQFGLFRRA
jgi:MFS family permease